MRTVEEAARYLEGLIDVEKQPQTPYARLGVEPVRALLARLGDPQRGLRIVHIAGSKGKGSTALFTEAIARAGGLRVGTFTSPHLLAWTERFRIDGREVAGEALAGAVAALRPHVDALRAGPPALAPTFFDATTAAALLLFREARVECAVLEVGLGGRLDSTNVVTPAVSCVTSIELEHTDKLGNTLAAIAAEKAGILKPGVPAVVGRLPAEARDVVAARAREVGAGAAWLGRDFHAAARPLPAGGLAVALRDGPVSVEAELPVLGRHQADNAALALACARRGLGLADDALAAAAASGLAAAVLPGRVELLGREPWLLVDAAHTAVSAAALAAALAELPRRRSQLVLSVSAGKDLASILAALLPHADAVTATESEPHRSLSATELAAAVRAAAPELPVRVEPDPVRALRAARAALGPGDGLCATGSIYLAGIARRVLTEDSGPPPVAAGAGQPPVTRGGA